MQNQFKHDQARKSFQIFAALIVGCLTLVSLVASYSIYKESFRDWPESMSSLFAFLITVGIEIAFIVLVRAMLRALIGSEIGVAGCGAVMLLGTMATNMITHHALVKGIPLNDFQRAWIDWIGITIPFATIALFVLLSWISPEAKERRQERRMAFLGKERALNYKEEYLNSEELDSQLAGMKGHIAEEVRRHIAGTLPPAPRNVYVQENKPTIGFGRPLDPSDSGRIAEQMRARYFPKNPNTTGRLK
jgi:hypothetical protein